MYDLTEFGLKFIEKNQTSVRKKKGIKRKFHWIDILVNAGANYPFTPIEEMTIERGEKSRGELSTAKAGGVGLTKALARELG